MTPKEIGTWTVEAVREWAKDLFATRDEAARVAHNEMLEQRNALRNEFERELKRIDGRLNDLDKDMQERLRAEREFREKVVEQALTRDQYQREHKALETKHDADVAGLDKRITRNDVMLANIQGKAIVYAILGSVFLATVTAFITHLLSSQ